MKLVEHRLVVDIGNTLIKLAVFKSDTLVFETKAKSFLVRDIKALKDKYGFQSCIYMNVRANEPRFIQHLRRNNHLYKVDYKMKLPIKNSYKTPETLGMDRLVSMIAAQALYQGQNVLVVDMGTCIKYDFIDSKGKYHGGNIAPGLFMRIKSMHTMTGKLPLVKPKYIKSILGKTTEEALQNGSVLAIKLEIEGFIKTLTKKWPKIKVILTGGDSKYFGEIIESKIFVLPELNLIGLNETLKFLVANNDK